MAMDLDTAQRIKAAMNAANNTKGLKTGGTGRTLGSLGKAAGLFSQSKPTLPQFAIHDWERPKAISDARDKQDEQIKNSSFAGALANAANEFVPQNTYQLASMLNPPYRRYAEAANQNEDFNTYDNIPVPNSNILQGPEQYGDQTMGMLGFKENTWPVNTVKVSPYHTGSDWARPKKPQARPIAAFIPNLKPVTNPLIEKLEWSMYPEKG